MKVTRVESSRVDSSPTRVESLTRVVPTLVLSHDAKEREAETEPGEVLVGHVFNRCNGKDVESKLRSGLSC